VQKTEQQLLQAQQNAAKKKFVRGRRQQPDEAARQELFPYNGKYL
jgi:hypothetical protein